MEYSYRTNARKNTLFLKSVKARRLLVPIVQREHIRFSGTPKDHVDMPYVPGDAKTIEDVLTGIGFAKKKIDVWDGQWPIDCFILYTRQNGDTLDVLSDMDLRTGRFNPTLYTFLPSEYHGWARDLGRKENTYHANVESTGGFEKGLVAGIALTLGGAAIGGPMGAALALASIAAAGPIAKMVQRRHQYFPQDDLKRRVVTQGKESLLCCVFRMYDSEILR